MKKKITMMIAAAVCLMTACGDKSFDKKPKETSVPVGQPPIRTEAPPVTSAVTETSTLVSTSAPPENESYEMAGACILAYEGTPQVRAMEKYYYDDGSYLANCINSFAENVGEEVNTYLMMIPSSEAFYAPEELKKTMPDQLRSEKKTYKQLTAAKGVKIADILNEHKAEYLYSRTDYHWQPLAAYYASREFAAAADVTFAEFDTYEAVEREGYLGAFYTINGIEALAEYPDLFTYYKPANLGSCKTYFYDTWFGGRYENQLFFEDMDIYSSYTVFVGTDDAIIEVDTDTDNDRVLVIFKDSYGNALVPFLTQSFSKIYICDDRFFNVNSLWFTNEVGATDVLFALGAASTGSYDKISLIEQHMAW